MINGLSIWGLVAAGLLLAACEDQSVGSAADPSAGERAEEAAEGAGDALEEAGETTAAAAEDAADAISRTIGREIDQIDARGLTLRNLVGEEVRDPQDRVAGRVGDVLFNAAGEPEIFLLREGGLFGVGEEDIAVAATRLQIGVDAEGELAVSVLLTDDELEALAESASYLPADFSVGGMVETSLLSARKIMGAEIDNLDGQKIGDVYDVVLSPEWRFDLLIMSRGGIGNLGDTLIALPWAAFRMENGGASFVFEDATMEIEDAGLFRYGDLLP